jgi:hypothetical protein
MGLLKDKKDEIQSLGYIVTIVCVLASLLISIVSLINSCNAENATKELKNIAENVDVHFEAHLDGKSIIKLDESTAQQRTATITVNTNLSIINKNPFRSIIITNIYATLSDNTEPSELKVLATKILPLPIGPIGAEHRNVHISWPVCKDIERYTISLLEKSTSLTLEQFKANIPDFPEVQSSKDSKKFRVIKLKLWTIPELKNSQEIVASLALY